MTYCILLLSCRAALISVTLSQAAVGLDRERPFYEAPSVVCDAGVEVPGVFEPFAQAKNFQLYKKQPLNFPEDLLLSRLPVCNSDIEDLQCHMGPPKDSRASQWCSRNYFNRYWLGHRRLKNAVMLLVCIAEARQPCKLAGGGCCKSRW